MASNGVRRPTVMVVEDNPITLKMVRLTLETAGYSVLAAEDGRTARAFMEQRPDLVLQDLVLPDVDGLQLVRELRAMPGGDTTPILAFSGFLSRAEQARAGQSGFTDYLFKPVEPSRLVQVVAAYFPAVLAPASAPGSGRLVIADDDPLQLKLLRIRLEQAGYQVLACAADGEEALAAARRHRPDAMVSDVLMPRMDGFRLCAAVRKDPTLARVPVVLNSSAYTEAADQNLAAVVGANALVVRSPDARAIVEALGAALRAGTPATYVDVERALIDDYTVRVVRQLERQVAQSATLSQRLAGYQAELSILAGFSEAIRSARSLDDAMDFMLKRVLTSAGLSKGAAFLHGTNGQLALKISFGYPTGLGVGIETFFGRMDVLETILAGTSGVVIADPLAPADTTPGASVLAAPIASGDRRFGVLVISSTRRDVDIDWADFVAAIGIQIGQALALAEAFDQRRETEARYRSLFDNAVTGVYRVTPEGGLVMANPALARILGYASPGELLASVQGMHRDRWVDPSQRALLLARLASGATVSGYEVEMYRKDGSRIWVSLNARPEGDATGALTGLEGTLEDVTQRRSAQARQATQYAVTDVLAEAESLAAAGPGILAAIGEPGQWDLATLWFGRADHLAWAACWKRNDAAAHCSPGEHAAVLPRGQGVAGHAWEQGHACWSSGEGPPDLAHESPCAHAPMRAAAALPLREGDETIGVMAFYAGVERPEEPETLAMLDSLGRQVGDFLQRKAAEDAHRRSETRYRAIVEGAAIGIYQAGTDGHASAANQACCAMLGYTEAELQTFPLSHILHEDDVGVAMAAFQEMLAGQRDRYGREQRLIRKNGEPIWANVMVATLRDHAGRFESAIALFEDITERRRLEDQLRQAMKMEAVGQLAGGVAHDFNNLLGVITGYSELLLRGLSPADPRERRLREIQRAAERAAGLTRQLLAFSRRQVLQPRRVDLNAVVTDVERMLRRLIGEHIDLITAPEADLGKVRVDPGQMEQVIVNLAVNARDAMPQGGKLIIATANTELDEEHVRAHPGSRTGHHVMLAVTDTGSGIPPEIRTRIFEPFFTTKETGKGTGLGLATVYGIVQQSGGSIHLDSELGRGTTFKIYFPRVEGQAEADAAPPPAALARGSGTVLLVEDDAALREMIREILEENGYSVREAADPAQAVAVSASESGPLDLMLTDLVMPGMIADLGERVRAAHPETRVVYMSGYTDQSLDGRGTLEAGAHFIQKPFTSDALLRKIREVLDARP